MHRVLGLGAGKIGSLVACLLSQQGAYEVHLGDMTLEAPKHHRDVSEEPDADRGFALNQTEE